MRAIRKVRLDKVRPATILTRDLAVGLVRQAARVQVKGVCEPADSFGTLCPAAQAARRRRLVRSMAPHC